MEWIILFLLLGGGAAATEQVPFGNAVLALIGFGLCGLMAGIFGPHVAWAILALASGIVFVSARKEG